MSLWDDYKYDYCYQDVDEEQCLIYRTCKYCGESKLIWKETPRGWRLHTVKGILHDCKR